MKLNYTGKNNKPMHFYYAPNNNNRNREPAVFSGGYEGQIGNYRRVIMTDRQA